MTTYTYTQLETLWINAGGSKAIAPLMAAIAMAESGGNSTATNHNTNGTTDFGLWQINSVNGGSTALFDPAANAKEALKIYNSQGLKAWTTYNTGAYKQFYNSSIVASSLPQGGTDTSASLTSASGILGGLLSFPTQITTFFSDANDFVKAIMWLAQPSSWIRIGAFIIGVALLLFAIHAFLAVGEGGDIFPKAPAIVPVPV